MNGPSLPVVDQWNVTLLTESLRAVQTVCRQSNPGTPDKASGRILLEYVSANPNGPVTAAHGRGGVLGDTLSALLAFTGNTVLREFYVNDATSSRQMRQFARALLARYRQLFGQTAWQTEIGYPEEYVTQTAQRLIEAVGDRFLGRDDETVVTELQETAAHLIRDRQESVLTALQVTFDNWYSEEALHQRGSDKWASNAHLSMVQTILDRLKTTGDAYEQGNALWLRSTAYGDEVDRVLQRADGTVTYLAADLAYHADKFDRGYTELIDIWDSDHASYIPRTRAGLAALGYDPARLTVLLHGPVRLLRDGMEVHSLTSGLSTGVTLEELLEQVPADTARIFLLKGNPETLLDVDADMAQRKDRANPHWALEYGQEVAHWARANALGDAITGADGSPKLLETVLLFPEEVRFAATHHAPGHFVEYAVTLANLWTDFIAEGNRPLPLLAETVTDVLTTATRLLYKTREERREK